MYRILVIEDDEMLREQIVEVLAANEYDVFFVEDFHNVLKMVEDIKPDLITLDINLPYMDGNYFCRTIRKKYSMPIIVTSARNSDTDQILSIELGCDDYIVKPFSIQLLLSKITASLRRSYGEFNRGQDKSNTRIGRLESPPQSTALRRDVLELNDNGMKLSHNGQEYDLTKTEYKLLRKFMNNPGEVISREELLNEIWDDKDFVDDNTLTVNITRVKKLLEKMGLNNIIKTKRGVGYVFCQEDVNE